MACRCRLDARSTTSGNAAQLIRIARLRRFVGLFARGGDRDATAEALTELAHAARAGGLSIDALRRARQAAQLLTEEPGEPGVRALLDLGSICLETGAPDAAASAAEVARERSEQLPEPRRAELFAAATLLAGIAHGLNGAEDEARDRLSDARDRLIAIGQPAAAALALVQQGLLDVAADHPEGAELCFAYARDFYRAAGLPLAAVEAAAVAAHAFTDAGPWSQAERWFITAIGEADLVGAPALAAELVVDRAAELERNGSPAEAVRVATDAARRCSMLRKDANPDELKLRVRLQLARLLDEPREALRHIEAVFEMALTRRDPSALGGALEVLVSGIVHERFTAAEWRLVARYRDLLAAAGFDALATTADTALADFQQ